MLCYVMLCYVMLCYVLFCYVMQCCINGIVSIFGDTLEKLPVNVYNFPFFVLYG